MTSVTSRTNNFANSGLPWAVQDEIQKRAAKTHKDPNPYAKYRDDPEAYAQEVLGVVWWEKQCQIARSVRDNQRTAVRACNSIGKTMLSGGLVNWHFDAFDSSITLTTAPGQAQVVDLLWKEVRTQRHGRPGLFPRAPRMERNEDWFAVGYTARDADAFKGRHAFNQLTIFDEAVGVKKPFFTATEAMMTAEGNKWLCIYNPTDIASEMYAQETSGGFNIIDVCALDHPNILAELQGLPKPFPAAVGLLWVQDKIEKWCSPIVSGDARATDLEWPPASGLWYRPGALFESCVLGVWPSQSIDSVWSSALWKACLREQDLHQQPTEIGVDVARFGDDFTSFHVRQGRSSRHHETHNGWDTVQNAYHCKLLCKEKAQPGEDPKSILMKIDDDGVGGGLTDILVADGYNVERVNAGHAAIEEEDYPNRRSELWFNTAQRAYHGNVDFSRLDKESKKLLQIQLMQPKWKPNSAGQRVVEPKEQTKKRLERSPDDADAMNLAYAPPIKRSRIILASPNELKPTMSPADEEHLKKRKIEEKKVADRMPDDLKRHVAALLNRR